MERFDDITEKNLPVVAGTYPEKADWLVTVLGLSGKALPSIREQVRDLLRECELKNEDKANRDISLQVSSILIKRSALKAGVSGCLTATPAALPFIGTVGTAIVGTTADLAYLVRTQVELCYAIAAAYEASIDEEELRAVTLALIGFSGSGELLKGIAASTLKSIVDATAAKYLKKGIADAATDVAQKFGPRLLGRAYKLIPLVSIPLSVSMNITSTMMVGNQARKYFSTGDDNL